VKSLIFYEIISIFAETKCHYSEQITKIKQ
jgi:hypothetical protein